MFYIYKRYLMFYLKGRIEGKVRERGKRGRGREKGNGALYPLASGVRGKGAREKGGERKDANLNKRRRRREGQVRRHSTFPSIKKLGGEQKK